MPITSHRMITLLNAATALITSYSTLLARAEAHLQAARSDPAPRADPLADLEGLVETIHAHAPTFPTISTVANERAHFQARRPRSPRQSLSVNPAPPAPISIDQLHQKIWLTFCASGEPALTYSEIAEIIAQMGEPAHATQLRLIEQLQSERRVIPNDMAGELIPIQPPETPKSILDDE